MKTPSKLATLLLGLAMIAAISPVEELLKAKDHANLGKQIQAYYKSKKTNKDVTERKNDLAESFSKFNKKLGKKLKREFDLLSSQEDMEAAFTQSKVYPKRASAGKTVEFSHPTPVGVPAEYALRAPKSYKSSKGPYPLILIIPDEKEAPDRHLDSDWMLGELRDGVILAALTMPEDPSMWGVMGVKEFGGAEAVMFSLRNIQQEYAVDSNQVFLAGHGAGVAAAVDIANMFPSTFAGVIGRAGDVGDTDPTNFRNLKTYFQGGGSNVTEFGEKATALEYDTVTVDPAGKIEDLWTWLQATSREAHPKSISFIPSMIYGTSAYWMNVSGFDLDLEEKPMITAIVDREKNVISITSTGFTQVTLYLNDTIVDLNREVQVICNGVDHKDTFSPDLSVALETFYNSNDAGRIYTAYQVYDLPKPEGN